MRKISKILNEALGHENALVLGIILVIFSLLRLPSVVEPHWYGDEGIYEVVGMALNNGRSLYEGIWDNKPPLLYIIYQVVNGDLFLARVLSLIFGIFSVIVFFALSRKFFKNPISVLISSLLFAVIFGSPFIEGNIANAENFLILPVLLAFYFAYDVAEKKKVLCFSIAGVLLSIAFLIKIVAVFDMLALVLGLFMMRHMDTLKLNLKKLKLKSIKLKEELIIIAAFIIPILLTSVYFLIKGTLPHFFQAAFFSNINYVAYGNYFFVSNGLLLLKFVVLLFVLFIIFHYRRKLADPGVLICAWFVCEFFSAFFSHRPYTHYLLVLLPAFCMFIGFIFEKKNMLKITIPILLFALILIDLNFSFYKKIIPYYSNYVSYLTTGDVRDYQNFFDRQTSSFYDLAGFVKSKTGDNENIFVWGDGAQVYALSNKLPPGRFTVAYHITETPENLAETKASVAKVAPKYIIQTKDDVRIEEFLDGYELRYLIEGSKIYEKQF